MKCLGQSPARGFTLMEIMVALGILAVTLTAVLQMQAQSLDGAMRNKGLTVATLLARGKMIDVEQKLAEEGATLNEQRMEGTFREEGHPEIKWQATIEPVQMDISALLQFCSLIGDQQIGGLGNKGKSASAKAGAKGPQGGGQGSPPGAQPAPMDCQSMVGALTGILGPFVDEMSQSVRSIVLQLKWPRGRYQETLELRSLWIKDDLAVQQAGEVQRQLNQATGGAMGTPGMGNNPSMGIPTSGVPVR